MIYIFSSKNAAALKRSLQQNDKTLWAELLPKFSIKQLFTSDDQVYLDISEFPAPELKKAVSSLKKSGIFWGIIDPKGAAEDPAAFFFDGGGDYISSALVKKGLNKKRFAEAFSKASGKTANEAKPSEKRETPKLPTGKFAGWKSIRTGTTGNFFFLYVSITGAGKSNLRAMIGEAAFNTVKKRLRDVLQRGFSGADALLWMESEDSSLLLLPPAALNTNTAIEAALKMILSGRLIAIEKLGITVPAEFTFALHYGKSIFQAPGKTGAVISEPVNYIFHLGTKKAEGGRLTISGNVPEEVVPGGLKDFFTSAGTFEGIPIRHSRRFVYK